MVDVQISEKKLEDFICQHLSREPYIEGFSVLDDYVKGDECLFFNRQINLGPYGIPDIVTTSIDRLSGAANICIFELKKDEIDPAALLQILKYRAGIKCIIDIYSLDSYEIECILIGQKITEINNFKVTITNTPGISVFTYDIDPNMGIFLKENTWDFESLFLPEKTQKQLSCWDYLSHDFKARTYNYVKENNGNLKDFGLNNLL